MTSLSFLLLLVVLCFLNVSCDGPKVITLLNGEGVSGEFSSNAQWNYYEFDIVSNTMGFSVPLTALTGDPDLYISRSSLPSLTNYDFLSNRFGSDFIHISPAEFKGTKKFYIGVYGYTTATFTIMAITDSNNNVVAGKLFPHKIPLSPPSSSDPPKPTTLLPNYPVLKVGVAEQGNVMNGAERIYEFTTSNQHCDLTFNLISLSGDADLYLAWAPKVPSRTSYDYFSAAWRDDSIDISAANSKVETKMYVGIYGFAVADYSIIVLAKNCK